MKNYIRLAHGYFFAKNYIINKGYRISIDNIILYSMIKYILTRLLWGDFCINYL